MVYTAICKIYGSVVKILHFTITYYFAHAVSCGFWFLMVAVNDMLQKHEGSAWFMEGETRVRPVDVNQVERVETVRRECEVEVLLERGLGGFLEVLQSLLQGSGEGFDLGWVDLLQHRSIRCTQSFVSLMWLARDSCIM